MADQSDQTTHQQYIETSSRDYESHAPGMYPEQRIAVLTCMDTRIDALSGLGFEVGDAHILRNAGGRVTEDVIRSLVLSSAVLGVNEVAVLHHTKCGIGAAEQNLRQKASEALGIDTGDMFFHGFESLEQSVIDDVKHLAEHPLLTKISTFWGGVLDIDTHDVTAIA